MRVGSVLAMCAVVVGLGRSAHADAKGDVAAKIKQAMEQYDMMDYDAARKLLNQALASAKKSKIDKDPIVAKAYLDLGIIAFAQPDMDAAKLSFLSAVQIDPKIQLDPAYKTADMAKLLDQARSEASGGAAADTSEAGGGADCGGVKGLEHTIIETAKANSPLPIEAMLAPNVKASKVSVMYRAEGATDFTEVKMTKSGECKYNATIPASGMHGSLVHYYVAAFNDNNKPIAAKGSAGSPNIMELTASKGPPPKDDEDPINGNKGPAKTPESHAAAPVSGGEVNTTVEVGGPRRPHVLIAVTGGGSSAYLSQSYMTEAANPVKTSGFGNPTAVVMPEIGFYVSPQISISAAGRLGFPVGANVDGHATLGPGGLLRLRYALSPTGDGVKLLFQGGFGIMRSTIKLDNNQPGMDTDVVAQGPLLVGAGLGYWKNLGGAVSFVADFSALAGIAVASSLGSAPKLYTGADLDFSLGLAFGF